MRIFKMSNMIYIGIGVVILFAFCAYKIYQVHKKNHLKELAEDEKMMSYMKKSAGSLNDKKRETQVLKDIIADRK